MLFRNQRDSNLTGCDWELFNTGLMYEYEDKREVFIYSYFARTLLLITTVAFN
jgi:hypothetical protein